MRFALSLSPTIGPPSSLSPLAHPTSVPCRRNFTHLIRVPHQTRTAPLSPSLTPAALEASVVTILSTSVASLLPFFFHHIQRNDGDTNSLAELLSASAEERAILDSIDVPPSRPPAPSRVHRQPALLFRPRCVQNQICHFTQQRAFLRMMIYSKIDSIVEFKHASRRVSLPFACRWRRKFLHPFWHLPSRFRVLPQN